MRRELKIACRKGSEIVNPLWFFLIVITLFPLGIGPEPQLLARIAPGIVWVAALLASLLSLERLFRDDFLDGSLEQLLLLPTPLPMTVLGKVCAHWVVTGLPLLILSPLVALLLSLDMQTAGGGGDAVARHADAESDRRYRRGADGRPAQRGCAAQPAGAAAVYPGADLRHRRDRRRLDGHADRRLPGDTRRDAGGQRDIGTVCHRGGAASERALANVLNEQTGQGRQERTPQKIFAVSSARGGRRIKITVSTDDNVEMVTSTGAA